MPEKPAPVCPLNEGHLNATIRSTPSFIWPWCRDEELSSPAYLAGEEAGTLATPDVFFDADAPHHINASI